MTRSKIRPALAAALGLTALTLASVVPGAEGADVAGSVEVAPDIRSITVSPESVSVASQCRSGGMDTQGKLVLPNGVCYTEAITVTNTGSPGNVVVSASNIRGPGAGTAVPWQLCSGTGASRCTNNGQPGTDQARLTLFNTAGNTSFTQTLGLEPVKDANFGLAADPNASPGEAHEYLLELKAPSTSTSNPTTRTFGLSWNITPPGGAM